MLRLRLVVGSVVRSLGSGGGNTSSTRRRGFPTMGESMSTIQWHSLSYCGLSVMRYNDIYNDVWM